MKYPKINTLFNRDEKKRIIIGEFCEPEFEYLRNVMWECTEKIDGTNIRIEIYCDPSVNYFTADFKGRTDNAVVPPMLMLRLKLIFTAAKVHAFLSKTNLTKPFFATIFGEGYGFKIQNGANYIPNDVDFILFDVNIDGLWLNRNSIEEIAQFFDIKIVPIIGYYTIPEAIEIVRNGFKSTISENKEYDAEGLVLRTPCGLISRKGDRLVTKLKTKDFRN